jgi:hypothetical protein
MKFNRFIWLPRILLFLLVLFFFYISFHVFGWGGTGIHHIKLFVIHNIPTVILLLLLWFSRKNPLWSGILLIVIGFIFTLQYSTYKHNFNFITTKQTLNFLIRSVLPAFTGVLFIITQYLPKVVEKKEPAS